MARRSPFLNLAWVGLLVGFMACHGHHGTLPPPSELSATLGSGGGSLNGPDGTRLSLASGAVDGDIPFKIARSSVGAPTLMGVGLASPMYEVTPHGTPFEVSALFSVPYDASKVPAGDKPFLLRAQPGGSWQVVPAADDGHRLTADLPGLSWYAVGVCTPDSQGFSFGAGDCPADHALKLEYLDGSGVAIAVSRDASGFALPFLPDITAPTTLPLRLTWTRPQGVNRVDSVGLSFSQQPGIKSLTTPLYGDVNQAAYSRDFLITVDPAAVDGAGRPGGKVIRFNANAAYSAEAFVLGQGTRTVGWNFETDIAFRVRYIGPLAPTILTQPADQAVLVGSTATFSVVASGYFPAYQWQKSTDGGATWADLSGVTGTSYTTPAAVLADDQTRFRVNVTATNPNSGVKATVSSRAALLAVSQPQVPPTIPVDQPADLTVTEGQSATFTVAPTGTAPFTYEWRRQNTGIGAPSQPSYTLPAAKLTDNGATFRVMVTNAAGYAISRDAVLTVLPASTARIQSFTATPASIQPGGTSSLVAVFTGGTGVIDQGIGTVVSGQSYPVTPAASTTYTLTVTDANAQSVQATATVTVGLPVGNMITGRYDHTATLLGNGKVLVAGGSYSTGEPMETCELFDPATGQFTATGAMVSARANHTATLLPSGKVLVAGGVIAASGMSATASVELYDPATGLWSATGSLPSGIYNHSATLLPNGQVLVAGGTDGNGGPLAAVSIYDPASGAWTAGSTMPTGRFGHKAVLLSGGKVLVAGGYVRSGQYAVVTALADQYDPATNTWSGTGNLVAARSGFTLTALANGKVLAAGGYGMTGNLASAETYDPAAGTWTATGAMSVARRFPTANLLADGTVLLAGGENAIYQSGNTAERFDPVTGTFTAAGFMSPGVKQHASATLANGKVLVTGGLFANLPTTAASLYDPATDTWVE